MGGGDATFQRLHDLKPAAFPELAKAFAAADGGLAQLAVFPPKDAAQSPGQHHADAAGRGRRRFQQGPFARLPLGRGRLRRAEAEAERRRSRRPTPTPRRPCSTCSRRPARRSGKSKEVREAAPNFDSLTELLTPKVADDRLTLTLDEEALTGAIRPLLPKAEEASNRTRSMNKLRQLALAALNYMDAHQTYPAAYSADKNGKPLLSWRVHLLPFLGRGETLQGVPPRRAVGQRTQQEADRPDAGRVPRPLGRPEARRRRQDDLPGADRRRDDVPRRAGLRIAEVTDGTSNTILFVEADDDHAVPWTAPDDLAYDPKEPMKGLGGHFHGGFLAAFADGAAHFIRSVDKDNSVRCLRATAGRW